MQSLLPVPVLLLSLATGCGGMTVEGQVTDVTGAALENASVTAHATGSMCSSLTGADGAFSLSCESGKQYKLAIGQVGYVTKEIDLDATENSAFSVGPQVLVKIPERDGLFILRAGEYVEPTPGLLARDREGSKDSPTKKSFCIDREASPPNIVDAGKLAMYAKRRVDWRTWKLDDDGCAYILERLDTRWEKTYGERVTAHREEVQTDQEVVLLPLQADSEYFIANWHAGFFNQDKGEHADDRSRYSGWFFTTKR